MFELVRCALLRIYLNIITFKYLSTIGTNWHKIVHCGIFMFEKISVEQFADQTHNLRLADRRPRDRESFCGFSTLYNVRFCTEFKVIQL